MRWQQRRRRQLRHSVVGEGVVALAAAAASAVEVGVAAAVEVVVTMSSAVEVGVAAAVEVVVLSLDSPPTGKLSVLRDRHAVCGAGGRVGRGCVAVCCENPA